MGKKRRLLAWIGMLAVSFVLSACGGTAEASPHAEEDINQVTGLTMTTKEKSYPVGTEEIDLVVKNETDEEFFYGVQFSVEKLDGESWVVVPFEDDVAWIEIALILAPKSENEETVRFDLLEDELSV